MTYYYFSPIGNSQQLSTSGAPLNAGTITTFQAGTSTPQATYADNAGGSPSTSLTLNTYGLPSSPVWLAGWSSLQVRHQGFAGEHDPHGGQRGIDDAITITADQKTRAPAFSHSRELTSPTSRHSWPARSKPKNLSQMVQEAATAAIGQQCAALAAVLAADRPRHRTPETP
jgi:hypothetical protein